MGRTVFLAFLICAFAALPARANPVIAPVSCFGTEVIGSVDKLLVVLPFSSRGISSVQALVKPAREVAEQAADAKEKLLRVQKEGEKERDQFKGELGNFIGLPYQACYEQRIEVIRKFVDAIDVTAPDPTSLYPKYGDWRPPACAARDKMRGAMEQVSEWLDGLEENIRYIGGLRDKLKILERGLFTGGVALFEAGGVMMELGLGGFPATKAYIENGLYLSEDLSKKVGDIDGEARNKLIAARRLERDLAAQLSQMREYEEIARRRYGADACDGPVARRDTEEPVSRPVRQDPASCVTTSGCDAGAKKWCGTSHQFVKNECNFSVRVRVCAKKLWFGRNPPPPRCSQHVVQAGGQTQVPWHAGYVPPQVTFADTGREVSHVAMDPKRVEELKEAAGEKSPPQGTASRAAGSDSDDADLWRGRHERFCRYLQNVLPGRDAEDWQRCTSRSNLVLQKQCEYRYQYRHRQNDVYAQGCKAAMGW